MSPPCKTTIIGGGLVGSLCACYMARRGHKVTLYEKREDLRKSSWAQGKSINLAMSHRARVALRQLGFEDEVLSNAVPMKGRLLHDQAGKTTFLPYDPINNECLYSISRNVLNGLLLTAAETNPNVRIHFEYELKKINLEDGHTILENLKTSELCKKNFDFLIGADGAHSTLRNQLQMTHTFSFSQKYIEHGYVELRMDANKSSLEKNFLHIWPRREFMLIALPNFDGSFNVTLFMPHAFFRIFDSPEIACEFFETNFPDVSSLLDWKQLSTSRPRSLMTIGCDRYDFGDKLVLIGDAAHAMVPFYGQGMNAGFEDCRLLDAILAKKGDDIGKSGREFTKFRRDDAHAICELSIYNYIEMRDLVTMTSYILRKRFDEFVCGWLWKGWIPLYVSVTFTEMGYRKCLENRKWQNKVLRNTAIFFFFTLVAVILILKFL